MIFIKVVMLTPFYYPIIGGITSFVGNLKNYVSKKGFSVSVIVGQGGHGHGSKIKVIGSNKYAFIIKAIFSIRKAKPDVLHSHAHWYVLFPCVLYRAFHPNTMLIHTFHTESMKKHIGLKKKLFEFLLSKCDYVTFVSRYLMSNYEEKFEIRSKKRVIYAGVFTEEVGKKEVENFVSNYDLSDSFPILSFISPLSWKMKVEGIKRLIEAFGIVKETYPKAKLLIVGDGIYRIKLERFVEMNKMTGEVIFTGFVESSVIPLSVTDIYTHISLQETLSISILEAMGMGKPIIAAKIGGVPELILDGGNGILVGLEPKEIADRIIGLSGDRKRMEILGKNAQKTAKERYDWEDIAQKFINLYEGGK